MRQILLKQKVTTFLVQYIKTFSFFWLLEVLRAAAFDKGDTQMWTQEIQCRGDEYQFALCPTSPSQFCSYDNHVTIVCAGR